MALSKTLLSAFLIAIILSTMALLGNMHFGAAQNGTTGDWPMFNHDTAHTGYSSSVAPMTNQTLWTFATGGAVETSPAVVNGIVYVGSDDGSVYALNAANGALIWNYSTGGPVQSSPAVADGVVYVGGFHSHAVFALNAYTGALVWRSPTDSIYPNEISSTTVANGLVYVDICNNGYGGELDAFNASTGNLAWKYAPGNAWLPSSPAVYGGKVYIGTSQEVVALDAVTGEPSWSYYVVSNGPTSYGGSVIYFGDSSLSVSDGLLYIGTNNQTVEAWDASTGSFVWSGDIKGSVYHSTIAVANGAIYASTSWGGTIGTLKSPGITALNANSGTLLWNNSLGSIQYSSPAVAGGMVFVGSDNTTSPFGVTEGQSIYALNATTGATIWTYKAGGAVYSSPAVAYGVVYVGSNDGKVYAIGDSQNTIPSPAPSPSPTSPSSTAISSPTPMVPEFSFQALILVIVVGVVILAAVSLSVFRKRLKTKTISPLPLLQNSTSVFTVQISER